jgi:predicted RNase H-like HicB family nuclease
MIKSKQAEIKIVIKIYGCKNMKLRVILEPSDEGGYTVYVPSLPGCISEGENVDEVLANIQEAIELYLEPVENEFSE